MSWTCHVERMRDIWILGDASQCSAWQVHIIPCHAERMRDIWMLGDASLRSAWQVHIIPWHAERMRDIWILRDSSRKVPCHVERMRDIWILGDSSHRVRNGKQVNGYNWLLSACFSVLFVGGSIIKHKHFISFRRAKGAKRPAQRKISHPFLLLASRKRRPSFVTPLTQNAFVWFLGAAELNGI